MPSAFQTAGAIAEPSSYAAIHMGRLSVGLWTNRSPLRDASLSWQIERALGSGRQDSLWDGLNSEISSRLTLIRRPGTSLYNSSIFPPINRFYEFRTFSTSAEQIILMADTAGDVRNATGPDTNAVIRTKSVGAAATTFQSVANTLYMGDSVSTSKWVQSTLTWAPSATFRSGDFIIDPAGNIQVVSPALTATVISVQVTNNSIFLSFTGPSPFPIGAAVIPAGLTTLPEANGIALVDTATLAQNVLVANYIHADVANTGETGTVTTGSPTVSGPVAPPWNAALGGATFDGGLLWINKGSAIQTWGPAGPLSAPAVAPSRLPSVYPQWTASTLYSSSLAILDTNGYVQVLTGSGKTGDGQPAWNVTPGAVTADGTAQWTNRGLATWQAAHSYNVGDTISVTFTYYIETGSNQYIDNGQGYQYVEQQTPVTVTDTFRCTTAGFSGASAPDWLDGTGTVVADGINLIWTNTGQTLTWAVAVGADTLVSLAQTIVDRNGNLQKIQTSGKSGATVPEWATAPIGTATQDGAASWTLGNAYSAPAISPQIYTYAFGVSVTGERSNASPASIPITVGANSLVTVQALGSPDKAVDIIHIYRTAKGGSTQFYLASIPAPVGGGLWSYYDTSSDDALTVEIQAATAQQLTPPPSNAIAPSYHNQRIFVAVQNVLSWSAGPDAILFAASGNSGFPPLNSIVFPSRIVRTWPCALGLIVFTVSDLYIVLGTGTSADPYYATVFLEGTGLLSYDAFTVQGTTAYIITSSLQLLSLDPSAGVTEIGFPIADQIERYYSAGSHLAFHSQSSEDTALYAADGMVGWFRMAATSAPESGFNWSPRAVVTGGCTALSSVEVSPGVKRLLLGPQTSGPILMRDRTVSTDNGAPYVARTTIGSINLAQTGQVAQVDHISLVSTALGSRPALGVLLGEIGGKFETLHRTRQEPPMLHPSRTLYSDRYALGQNSRPTICQHLQMQISWPAEDAANELIGFALYGAVLSERKAQ